jgi:hypothetical protein
LGVLQSKTFFLALKPQLSIKNCVMDINNIVIDTPSEVGSGMVLNTASKLQLNEIRKWLQFFAVLGIVFCVLMAIASFVFFYVLATEETFATMPRQTTYTMFIIPVFALLTIPPVIFTLKFSQKMRTALFTSNSVLAEDAFKNLRNTFRFVGIITILTYVLYLVLFFVGVVAGTFSF